jgi:heme/copper-type cytochrome/quinol oxidase subunit 4
MAETESKTKVLLARLVVVIVAALVVLGLIWYGFSAEVHQRFARNSAGFTP